MSPLRSPRCVYPPFSCPLLVLPAQCPPRSVGHASEGQGDQEDHAGLSGSFGALQLSRWQPEAGRLRHGHLPQDRRRGEEAAQHARHCRRLCRRDLVEPHPADGERHTRPALLGDHQQCRSPEAGRLTNTHFLSATRFAAKKAARINTIDDLKGKAVTAVAGSVNLNQLAKVNTERNLGIKIMPAVDQPAQDGPDDPAGGQDAGEHGQGSVPGPARTDRTRSRRPTACKNNRRRGPARRA